MNTHTSFILLVFKRPDDCSVITEYYKEEPHPMLLVVNKHHKHVYPNGEASTNISNQTPLAVIPKQHSTKQIHQQRKEGDIDCAVLS